MLIRSCISLLLGIAILTGTAQAEVTFEIICEGGGYDISADGTAVVGLANAEDDYDIFRWTRDGGRVLLDMNPYMVLGNSAGTPAISADGTKVSATILGADSTYGTQGVWTLGQGWQETMPPPPPDGGIMDSFYGSSWGLSGDGTTTVGLYWRPGQAETGSAHASAWTESTGTYDLGSSGRSSRANSVNYDGSVVVGWDQDPANISVWRPAVWVDGSLEVLCDNNQDGQAEAATPDGSILVGYERHDSTQTKTAAMWHWTGSGYGPTQYLGTLPGSAPNSATVKAEDVSADGSVVVGYNSYYGDPYYTTGFIWTEETGMVDVVDFLADNGISVPQYSIVTLHGVSYDGRTILGIADDKEAPYTRRSFLIHIDPSAGTISRPEESRMRMSTWPNPIQGDGATLSFGIHHSADGTLAIYDVTGQLVRRLIDGSIEAGYHQVRWDGLDALGRGVAPGVYFVRLEAGRVRGAAKLLVVR